MLSFTAKPDYETESTYSVTVKATDNGTPVMSGTLDVTVTITDVNEHPAVIGSETISFAENDRSDVATFTVSDPDAGDMHAWTLEGTDSDSFSITNGVLRFKTPPDFEAKFRYTVTVKATDNGDSPLSGTKSVTVTIIDVNEAPEFTVGFSVAENVTSIGNVAANDEDSADSVTNYSLSGTDHALFSISNSGALSFNSAPDFENPLGGASDDANTYELTVTVTSGAGDREMTASQPLTVSVTNENEVAMFLSNAGFSLAENEIFVDNVSASDQDGADNVTGYSLSGTDAELFTITNNGALSFQSPPPPRLRECPRRRQ